MRALEVREPFGVDSLAFVTRPDPTPGPREIVVQLRALSLNYRDRLVIDGVNRWRSSGPRVPVSDGVGTVVATGSAVARFRVGDRVAPTFYPRWIEGRPTPEKMEGSLGGAAADGLYAECVAVNEEAAIAVPTHLSDEEAATLPCAALTAWNAVDGTAVGEGATAVVLGTGGVSLFALQFAKLRGARVIITSSSDAKLARARELGADGGINYRATPDWPRALRELTGGRGADLVVDTVGSLGDAIEAVRVGGTIAFIGLLRGMRADVDLVKLMGSSATIRAIDVGSRAMFESMNRAIESAGLRPVIDRTFAFDEARDAFSYLGEGAHFGKICIRV